MGAFMRLICFCLAVLFAVTSPVTVHCQTAGTSKTVASTVPTRITVEDFAKLPFMIRPKLSPDGERVIARLMLDGRERLAVVELFDKTKKAKVIPLLPRHSLEWYRWAGDGRILISIGFEDTLDGEDIWVTRLVKFDLASGEYQFVGKQAQGAEGDDVLYVAPDGSYLLLSIQRTVYDYPSVYKVDLQTGSMKLVVKAMDNVWEWYADQKGVVRFGYWFQGRKTKIYYRSTENEEFKLISSAKFEDEDADYDRFNILTGVDQGVVLSNAKTGKWALYEYNPKTSELGKAIFEHPAYDVDDFDFSSDGKSVEYVSYVDDRHRIHWFDESMKMLQSEIDKALPGRINRVISFSRARNKLLIWTYKPDDPGNYYYYDRDAGVMNRFGTVFGQLRGKKLAPMSYVSYVARDGLKIHGYLTLPVGREPKNLPVILMPHGGPFARDSWAYDSWVQLLANRGYAVFQPNYRGSTGYGKVFFEKGLGEYGRGMQNDVLDGLQWLVRERIADPKRVCIVGGSYGGYSALLGATQTPELFKCAVSYAGISDADAQLKYQRRFFRAKGYKRWQEKIKGTAEDLKAVSPLLMVDKTNVPMLIAHGTKDRNVPFSQSQKMVTALTKAGKSVEWIKFEGQAHGFEDETDSFVFLKAMDDFLAKHNPAD
jgi:dipeptidyl aminopeptidase/acylaminoacyl peptidase